ncbi:MAG: hypothetical protein OXE92_03900 [Bacteroidetes bacterium]|nr:hypothetical protein [Bacteroidota bacterium]MCY4204852.1 hypothetical protein [Bacteroidota bacterium]
MPYMTDQHLQTLLHETTEISSESNLKPFLTDRIMRRIQTLNRSDEYFFQALWFAFKPVALASVLLTLIFISYTTFLSRNYEVAPTPVEIVFGLQPMNLISAYSADLDEFPPLSP